jgi:DNA-binding NtrC family response regulator
MSKENIRGVAVIVDDEEGIREIVADIVGEIGFEVRLAKNGKEALLLLQDGSVDLVVSDIRMPGGDGVTLLRETVRLYPGTQVIMMSGFSDYSEEDLKSLGAFALISKPFRIDKILALINSLPAKMQA